MSARIGDTIYVIGGMSANNYTSTRGTVWAYSVLGNTWTNVPESMPSTQGWGKGVAYNFVDGSYIYVFGGYRAGSIINACWRFDVPARSWNADRTMPVAVRSQGADITGNVIWEAGGYGSAIMANIQKGTIALLAVEEGPKTPVSLLHNAFPTLFRDLVHISYTLGKTASVNLGVYDAGGSLVRTLVNGTFAPGARTATWNRTDESGRQVSSGTYFYRLTVNGQSVSGKTVVLQ